MISRINLPVHFRIFLVLCLVYFSFSNSLRSQQNSSLPNFELRDQFDKVYKSSDHKRKYTILIGCLPEDREICRKVARKIYWKLQTYTFGKEKEIICLGYLSLGDLNQSQVKPFVTVLRKPGYEPVLLDWDNQLREGIEKGKVFVRGFDRKGLQKVSEQWTDANNQKVKNLLDRTMISN